MNRRTPDGFAASDIQARGAACRTARRVAARARLDKRPGVKTAQTINAKRWQCTMLQAEAPDDALGGPPVIAHCSRHHSHVVFEIVR